jgi:hypothetical protein
MKSHSTILAIVFGFLLINIFLDSKSLIYILLIISGLSLFSSSFSLTVEKLWFFIALILSKIIPNVLLTIIFFLLLTPLAFLSKLFNAQTDFQSKNLSRSVFVESNKKFSKKSYEKAW